MIARRGGASSDASWSEQAHRNTILRMLDRERDRLEESRWAPRRPARFHLYAIQGQYVLRTSRLLHWRCTGSSIENVLRDCACSLRSYAKNVDSITIEEAEFIAEALTLRDASTCNDPPIKWV